MGPGGQEQGLGSALALGDDEDIGITRLVADQKRDDAAIARLDLDHGHGVHRVGPRVDVVTSGGQDVEEDPLLGVRGGDDLARLQRIAVLPGQDAHVERRDNGRLGRTRPPPAVRVLEVASLLEDVELGSLELRRRGQDHVVFQVVSRFPQERDKLPFVDLDATFEPDEDGAQDDKAQQDQHHRHRRADSSQPELIGPAEGRRSLVEVASHIGLL